MTKNVKIDNNKIYSAREALQFLPQVANEPAMRKFIEEDMQGENMLGALVVKRASQRRFFIRGANIASLLPA